MEEAGGGVGRFLWGTMTTLVAALLGAITVLASSQWIGFRELPAFAAGTLPFALIIGILSSALGRQELKLPNSARYALGLSIGAVFGFLWSVALALGAFPAFAQMHIPVIPCWVGAGAAGLTAGLTYWPLRGKLPELVLLCGLAVGVVACYEPVRQALSGDQELTVVFVRWWPDEGGALVTDPHLSPAVRLALSASGIQGRIELAQTAVHGRGKHALAVFALSGPLPGRMTVAIPDADTIAYVQRQTAFEMAPENSPTLDRTMDLYPDRHDSLRVQYQVKLADGSQEGGLAAAWDTPRAR